MSVSNLASVAAALAPGMVLLFVWPRWWLLALVAVGYAVLFDWPMLANEADDLIVYLPPMVAWLSTPGFLVAGSVIIILRKRSKSRSGEVAMNEAPTP